MHSIEICYKRGQDLTAIFRPVMCGLLLSHIKHFLRHKTINSCFSYHTAIVVLHFQIIAETVIRPETETRRLFSTLWPLRLLGRRVVCVCVCEARSN